MDGMRLLRTLRLTNLLSYGPESEPIELEPLNVLIGPNGSGKSNLIEAISLLKAAPGDLTKPIRAGGGMPEWIWKGGRGATARRLDLSVETLVSYPKGRMPLRHAFRLTQVGQGMEVVYERIESEHADSEQDVFYRHEQGRAILNTSISEVSHTVAGTTGPIQRELGPDDLAKAQSILSQRKDPDQYPAISYLAKVFSETQLFRNCDLGHDSRLRGPQRADEPSSFLAEDGRNLGVVLNILLTRPTVKRRLVDEVRRFGEQFEDITTKVSAGTIETLLHEDDYATPSVRLSDGTLRYLCLLVILCHPEPPPLVCIEDPEIGLHPDILPRVAELLVEASQRMQLIVTTHSDVLVSALSDVPEAVVVCERDDCGSHLRRLQPDQLQEWLQKYTLGELWRMGETGGNP